jgi:hypothetical protein
MTGTICVQTSHSLSRSYLNHLVCYSVICGAAYLGICLRATLCEIPQAFFVCWPFLGLFYSHLASVEILI